MFGYVTLLFVLFRRGRQGVQRNLAIIIPGSSPAANLFRAWRVFWNFAWVMTDAARVRAGVRGLSWQIDGLENFRQLAEMDGGAILLTAHMGNYDIAGPAFAEKFNRKLNAVRAPERDAVLQGYFEQSAERQESEAFAIRYNTPGQMLGVDLARMLARGEVVVDGVIATDINQIINEFSLITLNGKILQNNIPQYIMFNKPKGVVSATKRC